MLRSWSMGLLSLKLLTKINTSLRSKDNVDSAKKISNLT